MRMPSATASYAVCLGLSDALGSCSTNCTRSAVGLERLPVARQRTAGVQHLTARRLLQSEDRAGQRRLARTGLADQGHDLVGAAAQRDVVDGADMLATGVEVDGEVAHLERGRTLLSACGA